MELIYLSIWAACILPLVIIYKLVKRYFSSKPIVVKVTFWILILIPTYDIILMVFLGGLHCLTTKSTYIDKKVEYPQSIYWEDNVYPGFTKEDRELMIKNYLDGVHLKSMALNTPDGKVYVYNCQKDMQLYKKSQKEKQAINKKLEKLQKEFNTLSRQRSDLILTKKIYTQEEYKKLSELDKKKMIHLHDIWINPYKMVATWHKYVKNTKEIQSLSDKIQQIRTEEKRVKETTPNYFANFIQQCRQSEKIYTKDTMPKTDYTVTFNEVKLNPLTRHFFYSDETNIIENKTQKIIAHNQRLMPFQINAFFFMDMHQYYEPIAFCGGSYFWFTHRVFNYKPIEVSNNHHIGLNNYLYKKYIKGEK